MRRKQLVRLIKLCQEVNAMHTADYDKLDQIEDTLRAALERKERAIEQSRLRQREKRKQANG